jgi:transcriptional regulator with XRE-family HTH domain
MSDPQQTPFKTLGTHLKYVREQSKQSLAEVSGAVEIDAAALERIEAGNERPHEDILLLLISYFNIQDQEAVQLWELAGYDGDVPDRLRSSDDVAASNKAMVMLLAIDMRTMYTDGLDIETTNAGMTLNFTQASSSKQASNVARLGMSYDQVQTVITQLQQALLQHRYNPGPKRLPPTIGSDDATTSQSESESASPSHK